MMIQLNPPLVLYTPKGKAVCHFMIDYGYEMDLMWVCFQDDTGECWTWRNKDIRIDDNATIERYRQGKPNATNGNNGRHNATSDQK
jgi:hypothetical protein